MQAASVSTDANGDLFIVLRGEIDFTSSPAVMETIRAGAAEVPASDMRVDLSEVTFMDSSGISVLVQLLNLAQERGVHVRLEHVGPKVQDQLHMSGLSELFGLGEPSGWLAPRFDDRG
jgi:anti-sigma B factor antagonist